MSVTTDDLVGRICALSGQPQHESDRRSLLHAYVACLSFADLCAVIIRLLESPADVRLALRGRLMRFLRNGASEAQVDQLVFLVDQAMIKADANHKFREIVDALHAVLLPHLPLPSYHHILERWVDRGTRRAMARWLKATKERPETFDANIAYRYWRATKDPRAAKNLAYIADLEDLRGMVLDLSQYCEEGWIISRAVIRLGDVDDNCWKLIGANHPATYLYLCAQLNRAVSSEEAYDFVFRCSGFAIEGDRGLAIWAIGQMGMVSVLDQIQASLDDFHEQDMAILRARHQTLLIEAAD